MKHYLKVSTKNKWEIHDIYHFCNCILHNNAQRRGNHQINTREKICLDNNKSISSGRSIMNDT